jgi:cell division protein FtsL
MITDAVLTNTRVEVSPTSIVLSKAKFIFIILAIILFILIALQLFLANYLAIQGQRTSEVEAKIKSIQEANKDLKREISQKGSLKEVLEKAEKLGFKKPQKFFFVKENSAVAQNW